MRNIKSILALLLCACMLFALCACGSDTENNNDETKNSATTTEPTADTTEPALAVTFTVKVVDEEGNPVPGPWIKVCQGTNCFTSQVEDNGNATFTEDLIPEITAEHELEILSIPEGYEYQGDVPVHLTAGITEYTVTLTKIAE